MEEVIRSNHNIIIEDRKKLTLSGVKDVISFDDETLLLETALGDYRKGRRASHSEFRYRKRRSVRRGENLCRSVYLRRAERRIFLPRFQVNYVGN